MFNVTGGELVIILIVALVILGPDRLPEVARSAGRMINKVKTMTEGFQSNVSGVMDDPSMKPLKDLSELAARPRQKLAEYALEAEAEERAKKEAAKQAADEPVTTSAGDAASTPAGPMSTTAADAAATPTATPTPAATPTPTEPAGPAEPAAPADVAAAPAVEDDAASRGASDETENEHR
jgi:sec-independent protein translocase protein TatB